VFAPKITTTQSLLKTVRSFNLPRYMSGKNVLVLYIAGDAVGQEIAEYYRSRREIPFENIVSVPLAWRPNDVDLTMTLDDANTNFVPIVQSALTGKPILATVTCGAWPHSVRSFSCTLENVFSRFRHWLTVNPADRFTGDNIFSGLLFMPQYSSFPILRFTSSGLHNTTNKYFAIPPHDHIAQHGTFATIPHFRLEVSPVAVGDDRIPDASQVNYCKRIIDDAIAAENAQYSDLGTVLLSGSGSFCTGAVEGDCISTAMPAWDELRGLPGSLYYELLRSELSPITRNKTLANTPGRIYRTVTGHHQMVLVTAGTTAGSEPTWNTSTLGVKTTDGTAVFAYRGTIPADNHPPGCTALVPLGGEGKTFSSISDVFMRSTGTYAYYGNNREAELKTDIVYRRGAIVIWSQSYGFIPSPVGGLDYDYGEPEFTTRTDIDCLGTMASLLCLNANGFQTGVFMVQCDNAVTTATMSSTANQVVLKEDGSPVATIDVSGILRDRFATLKSGAPSGWTITTRQSFCESRAMVSLKNGAAVVLGSSAEPFAAGSLNGNTLFFNLWMGLSLGEAMYTLYSHTQGGRKLMCVGDPLYRPFGHRR
jgi:hypothetical protein